MLMTLTTPPLLLTAQSPVGDIENPVCVYSLFNPMLVTLTFPTRDYSLFSPMLVTLTTPPCLLTVQSYVNDFVNPTRVYLLSSPCWLP